MCLLKSLNYRMKMFFIQKLHDLFDAVYTSAWQSAARPAKKALVIKIHKAARVEPWSFSSHNVMHSFCLDSFFQRFVFAPEQAL